MDEVAREIETARALVGQRRNSAAVARLKRLFEKVPGDPRVHLEIGRIERIDGNLDRAAEHYSVAADTRPDSAELAVMLSEVLIVLGRLDEATRRLRRALLVDPGRDLALYALSQVRFAATDYGGAAALLSRVLASAPDHRMAPATMAEALRELRRFEEALAWFDVALERDPDNPQIRLNRSFVLLTTGRVSEGWRELESRLDPRLPRAPVRRNLDLPRWRGSDEEVRAAGADGPLLVLAEQGVGDLLYYGAYLTRLTAMGLSLWIETDPRLVPLLTRTFPDAKVLPFRRRVVGPRGVHGYGWLPRAGGATRAGGPTRYIEIASLPHLLGEDGGRFVAESGYLAPDQGNVERWRARLSGMSGGRPVVGISWRSGLMTPEREIYYPSLRHWGPVFERRDLAFLSLQYDDDNAEIAEARDRFGVEILKPSGIHMRNDFDAMAALWRALDAVLAPSSTTGILAAAVGTPTLGLFHEIAFQPKIGGRDQVLGAMERLEPPATLDWPPVLARAAERLSKLVPA